MTEKETFVFNNLNNKSNAIFGFIVLQSLFLAEKLSQTEFKEKLVSWIFLKDYIIVAHSLIALLSMISLIIIQRKMNDQIGDIKKDIFSSQTVIIKIVLILIFSFIPVYVLFNI